MLFKKNKLIFDIKALDAFQTMAHILLVHKQEEDGEGGESGQGPVLLYI